MPIGLISDGESGSSCRTSINQAIDAVNAFSLAFPTGVEIDYAIDAQIPGWVRKNGGSIGSATSGATERANADTINLYTLLWDNYADAQAPVSSGRGVSAAADFSANKTLTLPDARGRVSIPLGSNSVSVLGNQLGEPEHTLSVEELPAHEHTYVSNGSSNGVAGGNDFQALVSGSTNTGSAGSGAAFNQYQPSIVTGCRLIKL